MGARAALRRRAARRPYRLWHHTHEFDEDGDGGTLMRDTVRYALPCWPLSEAAHPLVARDLATIFDFRGGRGRPCGSLHGERAHHAGRAVAADGAVVLVLARLEVHRERRARRRPARSRPRRRRRPRCRARVRDARGVGEVEGDLAGLDRDLLRVELRARRSRARRGRRLSKAGRGGAAVVGGRGLGRRLPASPPSPARRRRRRIRRRGRPRGRGRSACVARVHSCQSRLPVSTFSSPRTIRIRSYSPIRAAVVSTTYAFPCASARKVPAPALQPGRSHRTS